MEIYGKGAIIIGNVDAVRDNVPIIQSTFRKPDDKRGLGFVQRVSTSTVISNSISVTAPGFNWVKGSILKSDPMEKVRLAVLDINKRIASLQSVQELDILDKVEKAKSKALEISKRISSLQSVQELDILDKVKKAKSKALEISKRISSLQSVQELDILDKVKKAKSKALEINDRLNKKELRRLDRIQRNSGWKKVDGYKNKKINHVNIEKVIIFRVPRDDAELALLSAIRNGIENFRIEYTDK